MFLKIGEFARLGRVSVRMLRYYDRAGLLRPAAIDPQSGYRSYSLAQLNRLRRICVLRDLGFPINDIALLLEDDEPRTDLRRLLQRKQQEIALRIADDQARLQRITARIHSLEDTMINEQRPQMLKQILQDSYGIAVMHTEPRYANAEPQLFRVYSHTGEILDVAIGRADADGESVYTGWLSGYAGHSMAEFLLSRAGVLAHLETHDFPTQRLIRTRAGMPLGYGGNWCTLAATALPAPQSASGTEWCRELGAVLGRLHNINTHPTDPGLPIGGSWFYPEPALHEALHYLGSARNMAPAVWHGLLRQFEATLHAIDQATLPRTLIHGNPFIETTAQTPEGDLTLTQWHSGGMGVALLDLGRLLYACHLNPQQPWPWTITPDPERIQAVLAGYQSDRSIEAAECAVLPEAIRFSIAYGAAEHLASMPTTDWTPRLEQKLAARNQWYTACGEIAALTQRML